MAREEPMNLSIALNYQRIRKEVPSHVTIIGAAKGKSKEEILEFINAGGTDIGMNYVQEAEKLYKALGKDAGRLRWHMIGHLQKNKINRAIKIFEVIAIDDYETAAAINERLNKKTKGKKSVYIEINIGDEEGKNGVKPEYKLVEDLAKKISTLENLRLNGLMVIGPLLNPEKLRPYFKKTKKMFDKINKPQEIKMSHLSMGMSDSYKVAIEEGSNMIRIGRAIFGDRR